MAVCTGLKGDELISVLCSYSGIIQEQGLYVLHIVFELVFIHVPCILIPFEYSGLLLRIYRCEKYRHDLILTLAVIDGLEIYDRMLLPEARVLVVPDVTELKLSVHVVAVNEYAAFTGNK